MIGILSLFSGILYAQKFSTDEYNIHFVTMDDGLMHNYIDDIYKDRMGFLWFSTGGGLSRYDGYKFVHYNMTSVPVALKGILYTKYVKTTSTGCGSHRKEDSTCWILVITG